MQFDVRLQVPSGLTALTPAETFAKAAEAKLVFGGIKLNTVSGSEVNCPAYKFLYSGTECWVLAGHESLREFPIIGLYRSNTTLTMHARVRGWMPEEQSKNSGLFMQSGLSLIYYASSNFSDRTLLESFNEWLAA